MSSAQNAKDGLLACVHILILADQLRLCYEEIETVFIGGAHFCVERLVFLPVL